MPTTQMAKCFKCRAYRPPATIVLDKSVYDYVCLDVEACEIRQTSLKHQTDTKRRREKRGNRKW